MTTKNFNDADESALLELQTENALLRERLSRYEELYGALPSPPTPFDTPPVSPNMSGQKANNSNSSNSDQQVALPPARAAASSPPSSAVGIPQHRVAPGGATTGPSESTLVVKNFSQDGNAAPLCTFPNPYLHRDPTAGTTTATGTAGAGGGGGGRRSPTLSVLASDSDGDNDLPTFPLRPSFAAVGPAAQRHRSHCSDEPHVNTQLVIFDGFPNDPFKATSSPLYQTATFIQPSSDQYGSHDYTRSGNPTRTSLELAVARLEGASNAFAFSTGMAALHAILSLLKPGDRVIACSDIYGGLHRLLVMASTHQDVIVEFVDTSDIAVATQAIRNKLPPPKLVHVESPSNPLMRVTDIAALAELCHSVGALLSVDATMMTPLRLQPLQLGADVSMHSGTKHLGGHSDTMCGVVSVKDEGLAKKIGFIQNAQGTGLAPFDCWLIQRGMKTLAVRLERAEINAVAVAQFLCAQRHFIKKLHFCGLEPHKQSVEEQRQADSNEDPHTLSTAAAKTKKGTADVLSITPEQYALHCRQASGPGTVISFETGDLAKSKKFVDSCRLFKISVSFGSVKSVLELPCALSHASIRPQDRTLPEDLVRLSIGIEHAHDLIADLAHAIKVAMS